MNRRWPRIVALLLAAAVVLSACGGSDAVGESGESEIGAGADGAVTSDEAETSDEAGTVPETAPTSSESATAAGDVATEAEPDPDRSPPTTGTDGLESGIDVSVEPDALTCWRVEDFGEEATGRWRVINDGVMGGLSEGSVAYNGGVVTFAGTINTNGGGFSMIRTSIFRNDQTLADALAGAEFLRLRVRSANGRGYEVTLQDSTTNTAVMHFVDLPAPNDSGWQEPVVSLADLDARVFGTERSSLPPFDLEQVSTLGVILADGLDGPFSLEIDRIDACART